MADQDVAAVFRDLANQMANMSSAVGAQGIAQVVKNFDGDTKEYKGWVKSVEKYALLTGVGQDRIKMVAYQASKGAVSDFIFRYMNDHPLCTWDDLKQELNGRFGEITDSQHAFMLLRKVKQKPDENVQLYAERLMSLAEEAFRGQQLNLQPIATQLIGFFIDGLAFDYLKMKVMRDNPVTLTEAVTVAMDEQNLRRRFDLRKGRTYDYREVQPMEVDHYRPTLRCFRCNKKGHVAKECKVKQVNEINQTIQKHPFDKTKIICWKCGRKGHFKRECKSKDDKQEKTHQGNQ